MMFFEEIEENPTHHPAPKRFDKNTMQAPLSPESKYFEKCLHMFRRCLGKKGFQKGVGGRSRAGTERLKVN